MNFEKNSDFLRAKIICDFQLAFVSTLAYLMSIPLMIQCKYKLLFSLIIIFLSSGSLVKDYSCLLSLSTIFHLYLGGQYYW